MDAPIFSLNEAAAMLGVTRLTLSHWILQGKAPQPLRIGGTKRAAALAFYKADIEELVRVRKAGIIK